MGERSREEWTWWPALPWLLRGLRAPAKRAASSAAACGLARRVAETGVAMRESHSQ